VSKYAGADALHNAMDHAPLPGRVPTLEHYHDLGAAGFYPFLHFDELGLQFAKFPLVLFFLDLDCFLIGLFSILFFGHRRLPMSTAPQRFGE
jgi:hypothetical protein